ERRQFQPKGSLAVQFAVRGGELRRRKEQRAGGRSVPVQRAFVLEWDDDDFQRFLARFVVQYIEQPRQIASQRAGNVGVAAQIGDRKAIGDDLVFFPPDPDGEGRPAPA